MKNQIILITGCSTGVGKELCILLMEKGCQVVATARDIKKLNETPAEMKLELDVTDEHSIEKAVQRVIHKYGRIDMLINNAGYSVRSAIEEINLSEMSQMFDVNVFGLVRMTKAVAPYMRKQKSGIIINVGSVSGKLTGAVNGGYCASKHAVEAISDAMRMELQNFGIQVSLLEPGAMDTNFFGTLSKNSDQRMKNLESPYKDLYKMDLNFRKNQKKMDIRKAVEDIFHKLSEKKLKARYQIAVPFKMTLVLSLPDGIREKLMNHYQPTK